MSGHSSPVVWVSIWVCRGVETVKRSAADKYRGVETVQRSAAGKYRGLCVNAAGLGTPGVESLEAGGAGTKSATRTTTCLNRGSLSSQVVLKFSEKTEFWPN